ncbi:MAG TPA: DUF998 domain-containing protein [Chryseolinea sp.]|nr:DUF998 domain-containing protein [Chryseolinea sp.]
MEKTSLKLPALGGVIGPLLFTVTTLTCAGLRPGYSHIHDVISELGATGTPNADLMNWIGFIPSGIMISFFGLSLMLLLPKKILARSGSVLIIIFGLGMTVVGFFSCDEGCPREGSLENNMHDQISGPIFLCAILGSLLLGFTFRRLPYWRKLWLYSISSAILSFVFLIALIDSLDSFQFTGMWQRLLLLTLFLWFGIVGLNVFKFWRSKILV